MPMTAMLLSWASTIFTLHLAPAAFATGRLSLVALPNTRIARAPKIGMEENVLRAQPELRTIRLKIQSADMTQAHAATRRGIVEQLRNHPCFKQGKPQALPTVDRGDGVLLADEEEREGRLVEDRPIDWKVEQRGGRFRSADQVQRMALGTVIITAIFNLAGARRGGARVHCQIELHGIQAARGCIAVLRPSRRTQTAQLAQQLRKRRAAD